LWGSASAIATAVAGGRLFVGSENGDLYALNAKTGCTYWTITRSRFSS
jgi:outer membrane protein assembly factor BamB